MCIWLVLIHVIDMTILMLYITYIWSIRGICVIICDLGRIKADRACDLWSRGDVLVEVSTKHHLSPNVSPLSTVGAQCHQMEHSVTKWSTVGAQCHQMYPKNDKCHQKCHQHGQLPWGAKVQSPSPRKHNTKPNLMITIQFSLKSQQLKRSKQA